MKIRLDASCTPAPKSAVTYASRVAQEYWLGPMMTRSTSAEISSGAKSAETAASSGNLWMTWGTPFTTSVEVSTNLDVISFYRIDDSPLPLFTKPFVLKADDCGDEHYEDHGQDSLAFERAQKILVGGDVLNHRMHFIGNPLVVEISDRTKQDVQRNSRPGS